MSAEKPPISSPLSVAEAIIGRQSIRGYQPDPVPREIIERVLAVAGRAPSGSNIQPWRVRVLTGEALRRLTAELTARHEAGDDGQGEWHYYPRNWREPYIGRRRETGWGLYSLLGLAKGDREATRRQHRRNYEFFGAPVGLIFTLDRDLERGSWLDMGMFLQSVMLAARGEGLETCPQAAFNQYHRLIAERLEIPDSEVQVCGMAMGWPDASAPINRFRTSRIPVSDFATFLDELP